MSQRNSIHVEQAEILSRQAYDGDQYVIRLQAPKTARHAKPGSFVHLQCDPQLLMRRPLSIMRTDRDAGWIELLFKVFGDGTRLLAEKQRGDCLSLMGPIGTPFTPSPSRPLALLMGGGIGIPPMIFLADQLRRKNFQPLVLMGSEVPFPFRPQPSHIIVPGLPDGVIAAMPLMEDWDIASRLCSQQGFAGCFDGLITDLARCWLDTLPREQLQQVAIYACGPHPMLEATARLARDYELPCQVSLEEFMACAVGGCAGCTVPVQTPSGIAMKRVCVDGPVFDAAAVFNHQTRDSA